ncbi:hypothetical protein P8C59_001168 [Phyllachora maydis]|uniref:Uncharacterized protein n=1 Tax=Phyllachora maydis TaxID=1825666 RepID=A0AAD9M8Q7_9PEZI|nr:hypothetical protein P8C59_001168 [Phyllachora maydis]
MRDALLDTFDATLISKNESGIVGEGRQLQSGGDSVQRLGKILKSPFEKYSPKAFIRYFMYLPLNFIPVAGTVIFIALQGRSRGLSVHDRYFQLKNWSTSQKREWLEKHSGAYSAFGTVATLLEMVPVASILFSFTNAVGAALWAADIEAKETSMTESTAPGLREAAKKAESGPVVLLFSSSLVPDDSFCVFVRTLIYIQRDAPYHLYGGPTPEDIAYTYPPYGYPPPGPTSSNTISSALTSSTVYSSEGSNHRDEQFSIFCNGFLIFEWWLPYFYVQFRLRIFGSVILERSKHRPNLLGHSELRDERQFRRLQPYEQLIWSNYRHWNIKRTVLDSIIPEFGSDNIGLQHLRRLWTFSFYTFVAVGGTSHYVLANWFINLLQFHDFRIDLRQHRKCCGIILSASIFKRHFPDSKPYHDISSRQLGKQHQVNGLAAVFDREWYFSPDNKPFHDVGSQQLGKQHDVNGLAAVFDLKWNFAPNSKPFGDVSSQQLGKQHKVIGLATVFDLKWNFSPNSKPYDDASSQQLGKQHDVNGLAAVFDLKWNFFPKSKPYDDVSSQQLGKQHKVIGLATVFDLKWYFYTGPDNFGDSRNTQHSHFSNSHKRILDIRPISDRELERYEYISGFKPAEQLAQHWNSACGIFIVGVDFTAVPYVEHINTNRLNHQ